LQVVSHQPTFVTRLRERFVAGLQSALPEPLASVGLGLVVGQRNTLPPDVAQSLLAVGLTHIIAVSGYNLTILLQASERLLAKRSKYQATILSASLVGVFLLFSGASASIVRAAIVSLLSLAAGYFGHRIKPLNLLAMSAAITGFANPLYVWSDISWYLSFLAFFGVLILAPLVRQRVLGNHFEKSVIVGVLLESVCAEAMSMPIILHIFGQTSLVGLPANLFIAGLVPLAMLLSLIAGLAGMFAPMVSGWLAWPATLVLNYMLDASRLLAKLPHSFIENHYIGTALMLAIYGVVVFVCLVLSKRVKLKSGIITDRRTAEPEGANTYVRA
jgi:competence protein ComEC